MTRLNPKTNTSKIAPADINTSALEAAAIVSNWSAEQWEEANKLWRKKLMDKLAEQEELKTNAAIEIAKLKNQIKTIFGYTKSSTEPSELDQMVLEALENGRLLARDLSEKLNIPRPIISKTLRTLVQAGKVHKHGHQGPCVYYSLARSQASSLNTTAQSRPRTSMVGRSSIPLALTFKAAG